MRILKPAAVYFSLVFGVGFVLGPLRVLLLEPRVGPRTAELVEAPLMLTAILVIGSWVARRLCRGRSATARLGVGLTAAGLVLAADFAVGVGLRGMSVVEVVTGRDPVTGSIYYGLVALTAVAPWWFGRHLGTGQDQPAPSSDTATEPAVQ
jgi:hypothetical protein